MAARRGECQMERATTEKGACESRLVEGRRRREEGSICTSPSRPDVGRAASTFSEHRAGRGAGNLWKWENLEKLSRYGQGGARRLRELTMVLHGSVVGC